MARDYAHRNHYDMYGVVLQRAQGAPSENFATFPLKVLTEGSLAIPIKIWPNLSDA